MSGAAKMPDDIRGFKQGPNYLDHEYLGREMDEQVKRLDKVSADIADLLDVFGKYEKMSEFCDDVADYVSIRFNPNQRSEDTITEPSSKKIARAKESTTKKEKMPYGDGDRVVKKKMSSYGGTIKQEVFDANECEHTIKNKMAADEDDLPGNKHESASDGEELERDEEELPNEDDVAAGGADDRSFRCYSPQTPQIGSDCETDEEGVLNDDEEDQVRKNRSVGWVRRSESDTDSSDDETKYPAIVELESRFSSMTLRVRSVASINEFALESLSRRETELTDSSDEGYLTPVTFHELPYDVIFVGDPSGLPRAPPNINPHANISGRRILKAVRRIPHPRD